MSSIGAVAKESFKKSRVWPAFFAGLTLSLLPEKIKGQHRAGQLIVWLSSFPRG